MYSIHTDDLSLIIEGEVHQRGLVNHHLESANDLYNIGIKQIITHVFKVEKKIDSDSLRKNTLEEKEIDYVLYEAQFTDLKIWKPTMKDEHSVKKTLFPNAAIRNEKTYKGEMFVDVNITCTAFMKDKSEPRVRQAQKTGIKLCKIPVVVKSQLCNTHGMSDEALRKLNEDPSDPGGYFIIKGMEWSIDSVENNAFNQVRIFKTNHMKEMYRAEFLSQPGDYYLNSDRFIMRWLNDNQLTIEIQREPFENLYIPFFVIFRLLGWENDEQIFNHVLLGDDGMANSMFGFLKDCFDVSYQHLKNARDTYNKLALLNVFVDEIKHLPKLEYLDLDKHPENKQKLMQDIEDNLDKHILPHIGTTQASRNKKLKFLSQIIRELFQVRLGVLQPTDRDSFSNKRLHATGISYAKAIKTAFNGTIIQQIKKKIAKDFKSTSFFTIDLQQSLAQAISGNEFEKAITAAITSGSKTKIQIGGAKRTNRLSSQSIQRKNQLHFHADLRKISAPNTNNSKQSERSNQMRQLHMSGLGYVCLIHTPTSESVGLIKQLAITCTVTKAQSSIVVKDLLLRDSDIREYESVTYGERFEQGLNEVYVNGDPIGFCKDALALVQKYRHVRRQATELPPEVSIVWDNAADRAMFFTDAGRMIRPLLIVYNNKRDPHMFSKEEQKAPFMQRLALTTEHVRKLYKGEISNQDLIRDQVIEYISSSEQENLYLAANYDTLQEESGNELKEFTHCDIPQALLGLTASTSPYCHHNEAVRTIYQTSQSAQTCGMPALNWPYRCDKDTFLQYTSEEPLIKTVYNKFLQANGSMCIVAIMSYGGGNQEDGLIMNKGAVERGLFNGCKLTNYKTHLDQKESFAKPDPSTTTGMKAEPKYYGKLRDGVIYVGAKIEKGDVLIGKVQNIAHSKQAKDFIFKDMSVVYKEDEIGIVHDVIRGHNEDDKEFCKVVIRKPRPVAIGDKFSARSGQKSVCAVQYRDSSMPCTREGVRPDLIINPHAIPTRMTINQLRECYKSLECAMRGTQSDGTIFRNVNMNNVRETLKSLGMNEYGEQRLYVGETGEYIDSTIFMGPTLYQRLQKFVSDTHYCISHGPTDAITHQPLNGRASKGGLRIGEMECDVLCAHGVGKFLYDKFSNDSDGYKEYICRCGKPAIVNTSRDKAILKCKYCKSDADIGLVPTSWSAKTFIQEAESMNVGIRRIPQPFTYNVERSLE